MKRLVNNLRLALDSFPLLALLLIAAVIHFRWLFGSPILSHGDWGYLDNTLLAQLFDYPEIWNSGGLGGPDIVNLSFYPFNLLYGLLHKLGHNYQVGLKIIFLIPAAFVSTISSYLLFRKILADNLSAFISSLVYCYNSYFSILKNGHLTLMAAYSYAPMSILLYSKYLESNKPCLGISSALVFYVISFYELRGFFLTSVICLSLLIFNLLFCKQDVRNKIKRLFYGIAPFLLYILFSAHWFTAALLVKGHSDSFLNRGVFGDSFMNVSQSISLFHPFWAGDKITTFSVQKIPPFLWVLSLLAFLGFWLNRNNKMILFYGLICAFSIFLTKQSGEPFVGVYSFLYSHVPGFSVFRESSKFYFILALSYSVLIGSVFSWLVRRKNNPKYRLITTTIFSTLMFIIIFNTRGLFTGSVGGLFVARQVPKDYLLLRKFIDDQNEYFRTLWVPHDSRWVSGTTKNPKVSMANAFPFWNDKYLNQSVTVTKSEGRLFVELLEQPMADHLLDVSSIKYIIIPLQDTANDDDFFKHYGEPREFYIDKIKSLNFLKEIKWHGAETAVFENSGYRPKIFLFDENNDLYAKLASQQVSPSRFRFEFRSESDYNYVYFSESYHPQWVIYSGEVDWWKIIFNLVQPLDLVANRTPDGFIMWRTDNFKNLGTYTVYFKPSAYVRLGFYASIISLLLSCLLLFKTLKSR